jgi:thioredoxin reductase
VSFDIVIVGSGPAGLSAAARAAELKLSYVLLEATAAPANTIQRYQKGKHVMAEPTVVPLRSDLEFSAGTREAVLGAWQSGIDKLGVNVQYGTEVTAINGSSPSFELTLSNNGVMRSKAIVLAIGLQGNPRKLGVPGEDDTCVQYTLDDPDEFQGETIVIIGAGDAAIENAVALARNNNVIIVNRRDEFARAKEGNLGLITRAIEDGSITCFYSTSVASIDSGKAIVLNTETGQTRVECGRVIANPTSPACM